LTDGFRTDFSARGGRVWIGADFWANRLQDWRVADNRLRSELVERTFAHVCDTGGSRRTWLRALGNV
ncbi:MAG: hypothetical protein ACF8TS_03470, partial [Maioricimonas sp. JB049]